MFSEMFDFTLNLYHHLVGFFNEFYRMLMLTFDFGALGSFTLLDVIFTVFLSTVIVRITLSVLP